ncbi:class I SAM-dependent methyltransferase [Amycolatopsis lurida]
MNEQRDVTVIGGGAGRAGRAPSAPTGSENPGEFWENLYHERRDDHGIWGTKVNPVLVDVARRLSPGTALDLACGAGGDTLWLARQGWRVTATDISATAVETVLRTARDANLGELVATEQHDLAESFPRGTFDLVSAQYFHTPFTLPRAAVLRRAARALNLGGHLLVVDHGSTAPWSWDQGKDKYFPAPAEIYRELDLPATTWAIERAETPGRTATGPDGQTATVIDHVLLVRRTGN